MAMPDVGGVVSAGQRVLDKYGPSTLVALVLLGLIIYERVYFEQNQAAMMRDVLANQQRIIDMGLSNRQLLLEDIRVTEINGESLAGLHRANLEITRALDRLEYRTRGVTGYPDDGRAPGGGR